VQDFTLSFKLLAEISCFTRSLNFISDIFEIPRKRSCYSHRRVVEALVFKYHSVIPDNRRSLARSSSMLLGEPNAATNDGDRKIPRDVSD